VRKTASDKEKKKKVVCISEIEGVSSKIGGEGGYAVSAGSIKGKVATF